MMTPILSVIPFSFSIIDVSNSVILAELPERFVRCNEDGTPDPDHLYEVVETLVEARGFETTLRMAIIYREDAYYPCVVQIDDVCGWVRAVPIPTKAT